MDHKYFTEAQSGSSHSLMYTQTAEVQETDFKKFTVVKHLDGKELAYYDDTKEKMVPKEWIKKFKNEDYWMSETQTMHEYKNSFKKKTMSNIIECLGPSDVFIWQSIFGCEMDEDGSTRGHIQYGYNGDFNNLDLNKDIWTESNSDALTCFTKRKKDAYQYLIEHQKYYVENKCIDYLKQFINYGGGSLKRKDERNYSAQNFPTPSTANHLQPYTSNTSQPALDESTKYSAGFGSVGVIVGLFLIGCVGFFIWRKKKNNDFKAVAASDEEALSEVQTLSG